MRQTQMKGDDDATLVRAFKKGDEQAFDRLFEKYRFPIYSLCYRFLRNDADTQEVVLDVFTKIFHNIHKFREKSKFFTWAYRITVNSCLSFRRAHKQVPVDTESKISVESIDQRVRMKVAVDNALRKLPERQRMCFLLRYYEGYTFSEIGDIMHTTTGAAKANHYHAVRKLRDLLRRLL
jgi:RNA polymerase sigma-70 factor (ECF subfamily)